MKSSEIIAVLPELGVEGNKSHSSSVDDEQASRIRERIHKRARGEKQPEPEPELELPLRRKRRPLADQSTAGSAHRNTTAAVRPTIKIGGGGATLFRPPLGGGAALRPPIQPKAESPAAASVVPPAAPEAAQPPPEVAIQKSKPLEATALVDRVDDGDAKPEPPPIPAVLGPEPKRPTASAVPGEPNSPALPPKAPVTAIPGQSITAPPAMPSARPASAAPTAPAGDAQTTRPRQHAAPAIPTPKPPGVPGAPEPASPQKRQLSPAGPVRPIRPPGVQRPADPGLRAPRPGPHARPPSASSVLVPGRPIIQRTHKPAPMPGIPAPTPGAPAGFPHKGPGQVMGGMRPGPPGRPPAGGRPPGAGRGAPGQRRPRPPQQRKRDLEALAESKIQQRKRQTEIPRADNTDIFAADGTSVKELAEKLGIKASFVIKFLVEQGQFATINQPLELESIKSIAAHFGATATELTFEEEAVLDIDQDESVEDIEPRPPVVTIMGHVDHGKTSLLDKIRSTNVAGREAGGITQAIGAYHVIKDGKRIVFIDTPGHEAFTKMRAHGASVTDMVVLVVAGDDGVMPQTIEAIDHAKEARVPIIVAVNKMDLAKAEPERVKQQLSDRGLVSEEWGGDTIFCPVSAKTGEGIDHLLEMINLVAELRELRANTARSAIGVVLEAKLDRGKGPVATVLTQNGTLRVGDTFVVGAVLGKVRAMMDDRGRKVGTAGPSSAVVVLGLDDLPEPGDQLSVLADTEKARKIVEFREDKAREQAMAQTARLSLEQFQEQLADGRARELPIILKADFQGSATVLRETLAKLTSDKVKVRVIHCGVGAIKESDILLAITANAIVVGFNVRPERSAAALAEMEHIDVRLHTVIYELVDELKKGLAGLLEPIRKEEVLGRAKVLEVFNITNVGTVAGCLLEEGMAESNASARLLRDNVVIHSGKLASLRRFKDDVKEVRAGQECGMHFERFNDIKKSDEIEVFKTVEVAQDINELIPV
ncbi:MAG: translation initiation factor IF-2 [Bryobacterales bacterium]|nr:translation initiation factor IF-2 [Bryobacterales bacterium]